MSGAMGERHSVIIVDDDRETREMLTLALESEGFDVSEASSGLRLISSLHVDRPDAIVLDVMMSWMNGFELCKAIKQNELFRDIPVVFVSARASSEDVAHGCAVGAADYFTKPVDMARLASRLRELVSRAPARSS
jgi:DNA-binding response OmpR family regulator